MVSPEPRACSDYTAAELEFASLQGLSGKSRAVDQSFVDPARINQSR
jgi:hypothetical protein